MKKYLIYMFAALFAACSVIDGGDSGDGEDPAPPEGKEGIWIRYDDVHSADVGTSADDRYKVYAYGTYELHLILDDSKVNTVDAEEVTYTWTSPDSEYFEVTTDNTDSKIGYVYIKGPFVADIDTVPSFNSTVTVTGSDESVHTMYFTAVAGKVDITKTINEKSVKLRFVDNFNNPEHSTNAGPGGTDPWWNVGYTASTSKRRYWNKDAVVFAGGSGGVNLQTRKGKSTDDRYTADGWSVDGTEDGAKTKWITGSMARRGAQVHGYFEAKIKMDKKSEYHWDAFWAYEQRKGDLYLGDDEVKNETLIYYEYDMMEYEGVGNTFSQTSHFWSGPNATSLSRLWEPSPSQSMTINDNTGLKDWFILGLYWDKGVVIYYVDGDEKIRLNANGTGSSTGSHGSISTDNMKLLAGAKNGMNVDDDTLAVNQFAGMNFKFTSELGSNYGGSAEFITTFESALQSALGDDGHDSFYVDYYAEYDIQ